MCLVRVMGIFLFLLKKIVGGFNGVYINTVFKITQFFDLNKSNFFLWVTVFVSWGWCNKWLQTWWLTTTDVYSVIVLEAKSTKPRCLQGLAPSRGSGENPFHVPLWASGDPSTLAVLGVWPHLSSRWGCSIHMAFFSVSVWSPSDSLLQGYIYRSQGLGRGHICFGGGHRQPVTIHLREFRKWEQVDQDETSEEMRIIEETEDNFNTTIANRTVCWMNGMNRKELRMSYSSLKS